MAYVLAFAGNTWEVFSVRVWFVACLAWTVSLPGNDLGLPPPAVVSGLSAVMGVPVSIFVAELALHAGRARVVAATCWLSVAVCLGLAATAGGSGVVVVTLLVLVQVTSFGDWARSPAARSPRQSPAGAAPRSRSTPSRARCRASSARSSSA